MQEQLAAIWADNGLPQGAEYHVSLVLDEALSNIIRHGGIAGTDHQIRVRFALDGDAFLIELEDNGKPFDPLEAPVPDLPARLDQRQPGGLGVFLVRTLMDEIQYESCAGRNLLRIRKAIVQAG